MALALLTLASASSSLAIDPFATPRDIVVQSWTKRDGLPSNAVQCLEASPDGYIWIGTEKGLTRFDGVRFVTLDPQRFPLLENAAISGLAATKSGLLYIETFSGSLLYDGVQVVTVTVRGRPGVPVRRVKRGSNKEMWGVFDGGIGKIEAHELVPLEWTSLKGLGSDLELIGSGDDNRLLVVNANGLFLVDEKSATAVTWEDGKQVVEPVFIYAPGGGIWIGTDGEGLGTWDGRVVRHDPKLSSITGRKFVFGYRQRDEQVTWLGVHPRQLYRARLAPGGNFVLDDFTAATPALDANLSELAEDYAGQLWISSDGQGLFRVSDASVSMYGPGLGLPAHTYTGVKFDRSGKRWLLHDEGLCDATTMPARCFGVDEGLPPETTITDLVSEPDGSFLLGTVGRGVYRFAAGRFSPAPPEWSVLNAVVLDLHRESDDTLVVAGFGGVTFVHPDASVTHVPLPPAAGAAIYVVQDPAGRYLIGTQQAGLYLWDGGQPRSLGSSPETRALVTALMFRGEYLLVGTMAGLQIWQGETPLRVLDEAHGLGDNGVMNLIAAGDTLWVGHNDGVSPLRIADIERFARGEIESVERRVLSVEEGLVDGEVRGGQEFTAARDPDGRLWFTTPSGFAVVNTAKLPKAVASPSPQFEEMICDGVAYNTKEFSELPAGTRQCSFRFTALKHPQPRRLVFRYQLDAQPITDVGSQREIVVASLRPGLRRLAVSASLPGGEWSAPATIDFRVRPLFWQAWWFYAGLVLLSGAAIYGLHRLRVKRAIELERIRMRIASDLHDDLGSSLSRISILSEVAKRGSGPSASGALETIGDTARELIDQTSDIVWSIDPRRDDLQSVVSRVQSFAADVLGSRGVALSFDVPPQTESIRLSPDRRRALYLLAKEALHNSAKHAQAHSVRVSLALQARSVRLEVRDDGVGFDSSQPAPAPASRGGHGLASMQARAQALGGRCEVVSQAGGGTTVRIDLPL